MKSILTLAIILLFLACGNEQPVLNSKYPFVVYEVKRFNNTHSSYYNKSNSNSGTKNNIFGSWKARIVLPVGMYTVGDTIIFKK